MENPEAKYKQSKSKKLILLYEVGTSNSWNRGINLGCLRIC